MNMGRPARTGTGWRFGASLEGEFYGLGYCSACSGHDTPEAATAHYQQFLAEKAGARLGEVISGRADFNGMESLADALAPAPGQTDRRHCLDCDAVYLLNTDISAAIQAYRCTDCQERIAGQADEEAATVRFRKYQAMADTLWLECVPDNYREATLDNFTTQDVTAAIRRGHREAVKWAQSFDITKAAGAQGILFFGTVGTGKTHLAAAILRSVLERLVPTREAVLRRIREEREVALSSQGYDDVGGMQQYLRGAGAAFAIERYSARMAVAPELVNKLVEARFHRDGADSEEDIYNRHISTRLLVLDDLGRVTRASQIEQQREIWYRLFNGRYNNRLPCVVTSNKTLEELNEIVGEAVADRMVEMFSFVDMTGDSYRSRKRAR